MSGDAAAHVHSLAARARLLRALPGQLSAARLARGGGVAATTRAIDSHHLLAADAAPPELSSSGASSRADLAAVAAASSALDEYVAHLEKLLTNRAKGGGGGGGGGGEAAAASLLAQCARDVVPARFVASFARWADALLGRVLGPKASAASAASSGSSLAPPPTAAAIAALDALATIVTRAGAMMDVPGVRKEAAAIVQRAQPTTTRWILDASADAAEHHDADAHRVAAATAAIAFVGAALLGHPASLRPRADAVERALARFIFVVDARASISSHHSTSAWERAVAALAATPRAGAAPGIGVDGGGGANAADPAAAWSALARRVLVDVHDCLDVALVGVEPAGASSAARAVLLPAGSPRPPRVGAWTQRRGGGSAKGEGEEDGDGGGDGTVSLRPPADAPAALRRATALLRVLTKMLSSPFPSAAAAPVPADQIFAAARRALDVDGGGVASAPGLPIVACQVRSIHWSPYDHVGVVNVVP